MGWISITEGGCVVQIKPIGWWAGKLLFCITLSPQITTVRYQKGDV